MNWLEIVLINHPELTPVWDVVFDNALDWTAYYIGDKGVIMMNGPRAHVEILPEHRRRWCTKKVLRETIERQVSEFGYSQTCCTESSPHREFIQRLGYVEYKHSEDGVITYRKYNGGT